MNNKTKKILVVSVLSMILLITPAASQDPPVFPMILSGTIEVNGQPAPAGTIIQAFDGTKYIGKCTMGSIGQYGVDSLTTQLVVNEPNGDIQIRIKTPSMSNYVEANEVLVWKSKDITRFDLSAEFIESSSHQDNGRSSSSSSTVLKSSTEENNDAKAMPGGSGLDTGLNQLEAQPSQDTTLRSFSDEPDPSSNKKSNTTLLIAFVIGIIALIALFYGRSKNMY
jgi:hypothetical protein